MTAQLQLALDDVDHNDAIKLLDAVSGYNS
jgi:hypothetical protein